MLGSGIVPAFSPRRINLNYEDGGNFATWNNVANWELRREPEKYGADLNSRASLKLQ